jgi:hypothetical protein
VQSGHAGQEPYELFAFEAPATGIYYLAVGRFAGTLPAWVQVQAFTSQSILISIPRNSIGMPAESANAGALAVGAAPFDDTETIEHYSSLGPTNDGRVKPEVVGADCAATATSPVFCGTSQASPHVAGLAALLREGYAGSTPAQIVQQIKSMATSRGTLPNNTWGWGFAGLSSLEGKTWFNQAPASGIVNTAFAQQPVVSIRDENNQVLISNDSSFVMLSLFNANGATLSCTGGLNKQVTDGVASFAGCKVDNAGTNYQIVATPNCFCVINASAPFNVTSVPQYGVTWSPVDVPSTMVMGGQSIFRVSMTNTGTMTWPAAGAGRVVFGYHWYSGACPSATVYLFSDLKTPLTASVAQSGSATNLQANVKAPTTAGTYCLVYDMVHSGVAWFSQRGAATSAFTVTVSNPVVPLYNPTWTVHEEPSAMDASSVNFFDTTIVNDGSLTWVRLGSIRTLVRIHWYSGACPESGPPLPENVFGSYSGTATLMPFNVAPGGSTGPINLKVVTPATPGTYCLEFDLVHSTVAWFSKRGAAAPTFTVTVN